MVAQQALAAQGRVDPAVVADLCTELRGVLEAELAAGNVVFETSRGWPRSVNVWLGGPFRVERRVFYVVLMACFDRHDLVLLLCWMRTCLFVDDRLAGGF